MFKVSNSKVKTWRKCRQAHWFKFGEFLKPRRKSRPLTFGSIVHKMEEAQMSGGSAFEILDVIAQNNRKQFKREIEEYGDIVKDARVIMTEYYQHHKKNKLTPIKIDGRVVEHPFEVPIAKGIVCKGRIDGIVKSPNKLRWLREIKTFSRMPSDDFRWKSIQSVVYHKVIELMGWFKDDLDGTLWDYIRSKPPTVPQVLKSGKLSERKIDTLPSVLVNIPDVPREMFDNAMANRSSYFQRIYNPLKPDVVARIWAEFVSTSKEMQSLFGKSKTKNIDRHCDWCEYAPLCRAELQGADVDYVKEKEFYVDEEDYDEITADEDLRS